MRIHSFSSILSLLAVALIGSLLAVAPVRAAWGYTNYSIPYEVANANLAPLVDAGPDKALTLPTSSVQVTGTASDPDGTVTNTYWYFRTGPAAAQISSSSGISPNTVTLSGMTVAGTYLFRFIAVDDDGTIAWDQMEVVVTAGDPGAVTASLFANPAAITSGNSSTLTWSSTNATSCSGTNFSTGASSAPSGNTAVSPTVTTLYRVMCSGPSGSAQASATVTVTAAASYECSDGIDNDGDGYIDYGNDKGSDPDCDSPTDDSEAGGVVAQCSDGTDNDGDLLIDADDPGCHTDGNAANAASYDPNDNDEYNRRKPIYIEF